LEFLIFDTEEDRRGLIKLLLAAGRSAAQGTSQLVGWDISFLRVQPLYA
jgi:hypothetical protein